MKKLSVGDKVLVHESNIGHDVRYLTKIIEVTKAGNYRVENGKLFNQYGYLRGADPWDTTNISPVTDEDIEKFREEVRAQKAEIKRKALQQDLINFMNNNKVPYETLGEVLRQ